MGMVGTYSGDGGESGDGGDRGGGGYIQWGWWVHTVGMVRMVPGHGIR